MSESILDHGYVAEEHAPDPVTGHGDPTAPGKVAIWLFLASEIMFFIGILGTYIILRSSDPHLFGNHAAALSKIAAGVNTLVLIFSSLTMALAVDAAQKGQRTRLIGCLAITLLCALGFMGIKTYEYLDKSIHRSLVYNDPQTKTADVWDGHVHEIDANTIEIQGYRMPIPERGFDIHLISGQEIKQAGAGAHGGSASAGHDGHGETKRLEKKYIGANVVYGPWKNVFYSCYYALTGIHGVHVVGGIIPITLLLIQAVRGKILPAHIEYTGLYWHFVDLVWIFLFPLLYLI